MSASTQSRGQTGKSEVDTSIGTLAAAALTAWTFEQMQPDGHKHRGSQQAPNVDRLVPSTLLALAALDEGAPCGSLKGIQH